MPSTTENEIFKSIYERDPTLATILRGAQGATVGDPLAPRQRGSIYETLAAVAQTMGLALPGAGRVVAHPKSIPTESGVTANDLIEAVRQYAPGLFKRVEALSGEEPIFVRIGETVERPEWKKLTKGEIPRAIAETDVQRLPSPPGTPGLFQGNVTIRPSPTPGYNRYAPVEHLTHELFHTYVRNLAEKSPKVFDNLVKHAVRELDENTIAHLKRIGTADPQELATIYLTERTTGLPFMAKKRR